MSRQEWQRFDLVHPLTMIGAHLRLTGQSVYANTWLSFPAVDVPIVLAAMQAKVDYLVTLNRKHFIDDPDVALKTGLRIGTPGDALRWVRGQISAEGQR